MKIGETEIADTFAEAFGMRYVRVVVTGHDDWWLDRGAREFTGYGTSIIACDVEAGIERRLEPSETPDGRPGISTLVFGFSTESLAQSVPRRAGQCLLTCATTAVFDGLPDSTDRIPLGNYLRYFGDGFQRSKVIGPRRYWRLPVMDGEFLVEDTLGVAKGVAGGNLILEAVSLDTGLAAARRAAEVLEDMSGVIAPFPGGVVRNGSKVGSRYRNLRASTNEAYCPTLRGRAASLLHPDTVCAFEIVIDGVDEPSVAEAMGRSVRAAAGQGVIRIGAANYGGSLGKFHFPLHEVVG